MNKTDYTFHGGLEKEMRIRLEMLREVNGLPADFVFPPELITESREFFRNGDQLTVLATDCGQVVGCATICFIRLMPTFSHPTGKRAHLMNVYTAEKYRRRGIARHMTEMLTDAAKERGVTEISLDATDAGRPFYLNLGFHTNEEGMVLLLNPKEPK